MAITLNKPIVVPAEDAKTFDEIWLSDLHILARNPNEPVHVLATLTPARTLQNGSKELNEKASIRVSIHDFFNETESKDQELINSFIQLFKTHAKI